MEYKKMSPKEMSIPEEQFEELLEVAWEHATSVVDKAREIQEEHGPEAAVEVIVLLASQISAYVSDHVEGSDLFLESINASSRVALASIQRAREESGQNGLN